MCLPQIDKRDKAGYFLHTKEWGPKGLYTPLQRVSQDLDQMFCHSINVEPVHTQRWRSFINMNLSMSEVGQKLNPRDTT